MKCKHINCCKVTKYLSQVAIFLLFFAYSNFFSYFCIIKNYNNNCLCLYRVCVVDGNYPMIGLGGYVIPVAIVSALRVSQVINALSVLGGT